MFQTETELTLTLYLSLGECTFVQSLINTVSVLLFYGERLLSRPSRKSLLGSDLLLLLITIIATVTRPCGMWCKLAAKHEGQFQQEASLYNLSLTTSAIMACGNNVNVV